MTPSPQHPPDPNPVDDVRGVRDRLDREAHGDIRALAAQSRAVVERLRDKLHLRTKPVPGPAQRGRETTA